MITREIILGMKHLKMIFFLVSFDGQSSELKKMQCTTKTNWLRTSETGKVKQGLHNKYKWYFIAEAYAASVSNHNLYRRISTNLPFESCEE